MKNAMKPYLKTISLIVAVVFILTTLVNLSSQYVVFEVVKLEFEQSVKILQTFYPLTIAINGLAIIGWFALYLMKYQKDSMAQIVSIGGMVGGLAGVVAAALNLTGNEFVVWRAVQIVNLAIMGGAFILMSQRYAHDEKLQYTAMGYGAAALCMTIYYTMWLTCREQLTDIFSKLGNTLAVHEIDWMITFVLMLATGASIAAFMYLFSQSKYSEEA